jgi:hypothetical protein
MQGVEQVIGKEDKLAQKGSTTANQRCTEPLFLQSSQSRLKYAQQGAKVRSVMSVESEQRTNSRRNGMSLD